jgi:curved DNA-binding protein CbpA
MSSQPNHYEVLGLPPTASAEQIKKKYRELARLFHPDVNSSPGAEQKILSVNQAYRVLGDPERRAAYDAERTLQKPPPHTRRPDTPPATPPRPRRPAGPPPDPKGRAYYDGFGRSYADPNSDSDSAPSPGPASQRKWSDARPSGTEQVLTEAKLAFINRDFQLAQRLCYEALRLHPREAVAHEILGDIYARQGDSQRASTCFSYAIQFNPRNRTAQMKLDRLMRVASVQRGGPSITYTRANSVASTSTQTSDAGIAVCTILAAGLTFVTPFMVALNPGDLQFDGSGGIFWLSFNLLAALGVSGVACGILLAFYARMRPFSEEMWRRTRSDGTRTPVPLGAILGLFAIVLFYFSFVAYIAISAIRNRFSPSILRAYAATLALVLVYTLAYHPSGTANPIITTLLAGNVLFPSVLLGWAIGDGLRLRGRL